jgi:SRSO17 transposase
LVSNKYNRINDERKNTKKNNIENDSDDSQPDLKLLASSFCLFHERYKKHFVTKTRSVVEQAKQYLSGLVQSIRKNVERMTEVVPNSEYQSLQHFISHSPWGHRPVMDQIAQDSDRLLGGSDDSALIIDETSLIKKGKKSVGVARQWCGRLGKVDNCQVGVFSSLVKGASVSLIDGRLYLPKEWTDDPERCRYAGVPDDVNFKSKSELAIESIRHARSQEIRFSWVGVDGGYGKEPDFLDALDDDGEKFVADVHKSQIIYLEDPIPYVPLRQTPKGRAPSRHITDVEKTTVASWTANQPEDAWWRTTTRESTKGELEVDILTHRVWVWNRSEQEARQWHLVVRREVNAQRTTKYSLSNFPADTTNERLAYMQGQRFFVERSFQDAKTSAGMNQYQIRGWQAWHHHMALVMMTTLFMLEIRLEQKEPYPLLSCPDIIKLFALFLPKRDADPDEVFRQMDVRHKQRQASIDSAYARQCLSG